MAIATEQATILTRRGLKKDFDPDQMTAGEWAVSIDSIKENQIVWMCFAPGVVKRMGTWDDFKNAIQDISDDIAEVYIQAFNEIKASMEVLKTQTEAYKNTASQKADVATAKAGEASQSASSAAGSAGVASTKADAASNSADDAHDYATEAESYAHGGTGTRPGEDTDNAKKYYEQARDVSQSLTGALKPKGTVTFANLPSLSSAEIGGMYNISDAFATTADFKEGAGHAIPAGANAYKTTDGKWDILAGTPVTGVKGAKESTYRTGNVNITPENIGAPTTQEACLLKGGTAIPAGADLKDSTYINVGNYYCAMTVTAITLKNCPFKDAFILKVEFPTGENYSRYRRQNFIRYSDGKIITRRCDLQAEGGTKWFDEYESVLKDDLTAENTAATDTHAILGTAGADSTVQALIDEIADRVIDKLLPRDGSKAMTGGLNFASDLSGIIWKKNSERFGIYPAVDGTNSKLVLQYDPGNGGNPTEKIFLDTSTVIDALDSYATNMPSSANAVRELNEKLDNCYLLSGGTEIHENENLNDKLAVGNYYCIMNTIASTLSNCPFNEAFTLKVEYATGNTPAYTCQTIRRYSDGVTLYRMIYSIGGDWTEWTNPASTTQKISVSTAVPLNNFYKPNSLMFTSVNAMNADEAAYYNLPAPGWYNVISFCETTARVSQIAIQCYIEYAGIKAGDSCVRTKHDDIWNPWRKITLQ